MTDKKRTNLAQDQLAQLKGCIVVTCNKYITSVTEVKSASVRLFAGTWHPLVSVITTLLCCDYFYHQVWCHALSLRYACIRSSGTILIPYGYLCAKFRFFRGLRC